MSSAVEEAGPSGELWTRVLLFGIGLWLVVLGLYAPVLGHEFVEFDDNQYLLENPHVLGGLDGSSVKWAWTRSYAANWHPLTWMSHMVDVELFGLDPGPHQFQNAVWHGATAFLLLVFLAWTTRAFWPSFFVAALFALHPLRVESVAWASERKDVLSGFFWMTTLLTWAYYASSPNRRRYLLVALSLTLGLAAKPMLVTLPAVLLLMDVWPLRRTPLSAGNRFGGPRPWGGLLREKLPLFLLAAGSSVATLVAQGREGAVTGLESLSFSTRAVNALATSWRYVQQTLWPADLAVFYPHPAIVEPARGVGLVLIVGAAIFAVLGSVLAVLSVRRRPHAFVGWFWYLGTLIPVVGIIQVGSQSHADRYTYLTVIGFTIAAVFCVHGLLESRPSSARAAVAVGFGLLLGCAWLTSAQVSTWRDTRSLFEHAIAVTNRNYLAHYNLGNWLLKRGELDDAKGHLSRAVEIRPNHVSAHTSLGLVHARQRNLAEAEREFELALQTQPEFLEAIAGLGSVALSREDYPRAVRFYEQVLELEPNYPTALRNLGLIYQRTGDERAAIEHYRRGFVLESPEPRAARNLAWLLATSPDPALRDGREALRWGEYAARGTDYRDPQILATLAAAHAEAGDFESAENRQSQAIALTPPQGRAELEERLGLYRAGRPFHR